MKQKHVVEIRDIQGRIQRRDRFRRARAALRFADEMRSPLYDVLVDGVVVHEHTPPEEFLTR